MFGLWVIRNKKDQGYELSCGCLAEQLGLKSERQIMQMMEDLGIQIKICTRYVTDKTCTEENKNRIKNIAYFYSISDVHFVLDRMRTPEDFYVAQVTYKV